MIRVNINESFPITVALVDEAVGQVSTGQTVYYDVRKQPGDVATTLSGVLPESTAEPGIYTTLESIAESGTFIIYATCSGFIPNVEEIIVNEENIYDLVKQNRHYNISVEDVVRTSATPTTSQTTRNVPLGKTDYVIIRVKKDIDDDWYGVDVLESNVYAWYKTTADQAPYKMGADS